MPSERVSPTELEHVKHILQTQHGVIFFPKQPMVIPTLDPEYVGQIVGQENVKAAMKSLEYFLWYVKDGQAVGDNFGIDHAARRIWRRERLEEFGEAFDILYVQNNQFRVNNMDFGGHISILAQMVKEQGHEGFSDQLTEIGCEMWTRVSGKDANTLQVVRPKYSELESLDDKLEVVHFNEYNCLNVLNFFSQPDSSEYETLLNQEGMITPEQAVRHLEEIGLTHDELVSMLDSRYTPHDIKAYIIIAFGKEPRFHGDAYREAREMDDLPPVRSV